MLDDDIPSINEQIYILIEEGAAGPSYPALAKAKYITVDPKEKCGATRAWLILETNEEDQLELCKDDTLPQLYDVIAWRYAS